jgi:hypothetical protein
MVMLAGAAGTVSKVLLNLAVLRGLFPQSEVNNTLTLSPVRAAALDVNVTVSTLDVKLPESTVKVDANVPTKDHTYPVAAPAVVVADGNAGAA